MIKIMLYKIVILMGILLLFLVFVMDINVEFIVIVKVIICNIIFIGNNVTNDGNNNYILRIFKMGLDKIANKTIEFQVDFKLVVSGCSSGISWIDIILIGNVLLSLFKFIILQFGDLFLMISNIGMGFKKWIIDDVIFFKFNSVEKICWSIDEMQFDKGFEMIVVLCEIDVG